MSPGMTDTGWTSIDNHQVQRLDDLFARDEERVAKLSFEAAGLTFDWSKTHLDSELLDAFAGVAESLGLDERRDLLFAGGVTNPTEDRPAEHMAERGSGSPEAVEVAAARGIAVAIFRG